jgi:hypothetical protein
VLNIVRKKNKIIPPKKYFRKKNISNSRSTAAADTTGT